VTVSASADDQAPFISQPARPDLLLSLRSWQTDAYRAYFGSDNRAFLLVAAPGAGKTAFALTVAAELIARREISAMTVVAPTEHLKQQWARAAHRLGIALDPEFTNAQGQASADFAGVAVTYAQVAANPALHRRRTLSRRMLVVFDEIHHACDALSWGEAIRVARRRGETASVFLPSIPSLLGYAAELEAERDHVLSRPDGAAEDERALAEALRQRDTAGELDEGPFQALAASAHFDRVLYDGNEFGVTAEEEDFLGLPGLNVSAEVPDQI
jgi:superfamily II DNA or RNA helicase